MHVLARSGSMPGVSSRLFGTCTQILSGTSLIADSDVSIWSSPSPGPSHSLVTARPDVSGPTTAIAWAPPALRPTSRPGSSSLSHTRNTRAFQVNCQCNDEPSCSNFSNLQQAASESGYSGSDATFKFMAAAGAPVQVLPLSKGSSDCQYASDTRATAGNLNSQPAHLESCTHG